MRQATVLICPAMLIAAAVASTSFHGERPIDVKASLISIHVGKTGLFAGLGHDHHIEAHVARGRFNDGPNAGIEFVVEANSLTVLPEKKISASDQSKIQATMQNEVLEIKKYPEIRFRSTQISPSGVHRWKVVGTLALHGVTKQVTASVLQTGDLYSGTAHFKQTDFGIKPISIAGGMVKVKDDLEISFTVRAASSK